MTRLACVLALSMMFASAGCGDDDDGGGGTPTSDGGTMEGGDDAGTSMGGDTLARSGTIVAEPGSPGASGFVAVEIDGDGTVSIALGDDFMQGMGPGDTELRLAQADTNLQEQLDADPNAASPSIGTIPNGGTGAMTFSVPAEVDPNDFDYVIIWCPTAAINFGAAPLEGRTGEIVPEAGTPMASGGVSVWADADGTYQVTLSDDFMQGMGPGDTELRLAQAATNLQEQIDGDANSVSETLGIIPNGATGARTFEVPDGVDVSSFDYAVVWCPTAAINFGVAELGAE